MSGFWSELKRRKVPHVAGIYLGSGFAIAQVADLFFPRLGFPDWTVTAIIVMIVVGFPLALLLAWFFDLVPDAATGRARETGWRVDRRALIALVAAAILVGASGAFFARRNSANGLVRSRVAVAAFENRTGERSLDAIGAMSADWVAEGLSRSGLVEVVPPQVAYAAALGIAARMSASDGMTRAFTLAQESRAGTLVWGSYYREGDHLLLQAEVTDVANGRLIRKLEPVSVALDSTSSGVAQIAQRVAGALATRLNPRLSGWSDAVRPPMVGAYHAYAQGLEKYISSLGTAGYREAAALFERAVQLDSTFVVASLWLAQSLANGVDRVRADSIAIKLQRNPERLTPYDRAFLDRLQARLRGDWRAAYAAAKRMTEIAPSSDDAWRERALDALRLNRLREGQRILSSLDPHRGWLRGWPHYYHWQVEAHHLLGDHERELEVAQAAVQHYPDVGWLKMNVGIARAALRQPINVDELMRDAATQASPRSGLALAMELKAHHHEQAPRAMRAALAWHRRWAQVDTTFGTRVDLLEALYYSGEHQEAKALADVLAPHARGIAAAVVHGVLGGIAAQSGDTATAMQHAQHLADMSSMATATRNTSWRARIAALLGQRAQAVRLLEQAFTEGMMPIRSSSGSVFTPFHVMPELLRLQGYAPFDRLLRSAD